MSVKNRYLADPRAIRQAAAKAFRPPAESEFARCPSCGKPLDHAYIAKDYRLYCGHCLTEVRVTTCRERRLTTA